VTWPLPRAEGSGRGFLLDHASSPTLGVYSGSEAPWWRGRFVRPAGRIAVRAGNASTSATVVTIG